MDDYAYLFGKKGDGRLDERKEVKVRLPIEQLIRLHGIKLVHGRTITDSVVEALDLYFARIEAVEEEENDETPL